MNLQFVETDDGTCPVPICGEEIDLANYFSPTQIGLGAKNNARDVIYCDHCGRRIEIQLSLYRGWKIKIHARAAI